MRRFHSHRPDLVALAVRLSGILAIVSSTVRAFPAHLPILSPFDFGRSTRITELVAGLGLIYLASQLQRKKFTAYVSTVSLLLLLMIVELGRSHHQHLAVVTVYGIILTILFVQRREYVVRNDATSLRRNWLLAGGLLLVVGAFVVLTFDRINEHDYGRDLPTSRTMSITAHAVFGQPLPGNLATRRGRDLIFSLQAALVASGTIAAFGLFAPISLGRGGSRLNRQLAEDIVARFSSSSEDYLKLWPADKHYYFYNDSFIAYGVARGVAVVVDGATGDPKYLDKLRLNFAEDCRINGWDVAILHADESEKQAWEKLGLHEQYMGSEARVNIDDFCEYKARDKHFRYIKNRAEKDGLSVSELPQPLSLQHLTELRAVSDAWLANGRREYRFIMGYFDINYLQRSRVFAVLQAGRIVAYTNLLPMYQDKDFSIDHMRSLPNVSSSTMHYLLLHVILSLKDAGAQTLNLGLAPLSQIDGNVTKLQQPVLSAIKILGERYYSFSGLEQFKGKFSPDWQPTYIMYVGLPPRLALVGRAVMSLSAYDQTDKTTRLLWGLLTLSVISGLSYASFPLAFVLNPVHALKSMVSVLGQANQPYADVFNNLDTISASLAILIAGYLLATRRQLHVLLRYALIGVLLSNVGNLMAAYFDLPTGIDADSHISLNLIKNPGVLLHGTFSFLNDAAFVFAVICWGMWAYRRNGWNRRHILAVAIIALCTIGFLIGQLYEPSSPYIQRAFIFSYAVWFVIFCYDVIRPRSAKL